MLLSLLSPQEGLKPSQVEALIFFNPTLGGEEDAERKLLFCHPDTVSQQLQLAAVGLCEALIHLSRRFSTKPCDGVHTRYRRYTLVEAEPSIWLCLVTANPRRGGARSGEEAAPVEDELPNLLLQARLRRVHATARLFLGPLCAWEPEALRPALAAALSPWLELAETRSALSVDRASIVDTFDSTVILPMSRSTHLRMQSAVNELESAFAQVRATLVLYADTLVWSGLCREDTATVYQVLLTTLAEAGQRLQPAAEQAHSRSSREPGVFAGLARHFARHAESKSTAMPDRAYGSGSTGLGALCMHATALLAQVDADGFFLMGPPAAETTATNPVPPLRVHLRPESVPDVEPIMSLPSAAAAAAAAASAAAVTAVSEGCLSALPADEADTVSSVAHNSVPARLLIYRVKHLTAVVVVDDDARCYDNTAWMLSLGAAAQGLLTPVETMLTEHAAKLRASNAELAVAPPYMWLDEGGVSVRCTPGLASTSPTLASNTRALLLQAHEHLKRLQGPGDLPLQTAVLGPLPHQLARGEVGSEDPAYEESRIVGSWGAEICIRPAVSAGGWVVGKRMGDRSYFLLLDPKLSTFNEVHEEEARLTSAYFPGTFVP